MKMVSIINSSSIEEMESWLSRKFFSMERSSLILCLFMIGYTVFFSIYTILRHYTFRTFAWDLGIFTQSLWTTLNGHGFFYHTPELFINPSGSFFGVHFSPILFLILPLYWIAPTPETLLILQSFILALAAFPIYKLAREKAGGRVVGLVFALAYFLYPATQFVNRYDFHVQAFLPLFFTCIIYCVTNEKWPQYSLFLFLSLLCEEHVAQITFFIGVYLAWKYRATIITAIKRRNFREKKVLIPLFTMMASVCWYWFTLWQRDTFFPTNPATLEEFLGSGNFGILGAKNPLEVPFLIILRPLNAIQALAYDWQLKLLYILLIFGPLAFLSFKRPSALIPTIPWFILSFVSQARAHHALGHQYEAYIVSFVFASAIFTISRKLRKKRNMKHIIGSLKRVIASSILFFLIASPLGIGANILFPQHMNMPISIERHERLLIEVLDMVPAKASILTQQNLFPHVSHRIDAYVIPDRFIDSGIHEIIVDFTNQTIERVEYVLIDNKTNPAAFEFALLILETKPYFTIMTSKDNGTIRLYRRKL